MYMQNNFLLTLILLIMEYLTLIIMVEYDETFVEYSI